MRSLRPGPRAPAVYDDESSTESEDEAEQDAVLPCDRASVSRGSVSSWRGPVSAKSLSTERGIDKTRRKRGDRKGRQERGCSYYLLLTVVALLVLSLLEVIHRVFLSEDGGHTDPSDTAALEELKTRELAQKRHLADLRAREHKLRTALAAERKEAEAAFAEVVADVRAEEDQNEVFGGHEEHGEPIAAEAIEFGEATPLLARFCGQAYRELQEQYHRMEKARVAAEKAAEEGAPPPEAEVSGSGDPDGDALGSSLRTATDWATVEITRLEPDRRLDEVRVWLAPAAGAQGKQMQMQRLPDLYVPMISNPRMHDSDAGQDAPARATELILDPTYLRGIDKSRTRRLSPDEKPEIAISQEERILKNWFMTHFHDMSDPEELLYIEDWELGIASAKDNQIAREVDELQAKISRKRAFAKRLAGSGSGAGAAGTVLSFAWWRSIPRRVCNAFRQSPVMIAGEHGAFGTLAVGTLVWCAACWAFGKVLPADGAVSVPVPFAGWVDVVHWKAVRYYMWPHNLVAFFFGWTRTTEHVARVHWETTLNPIHPEWSRSATEADGVHSGWCLGDHVRQEAVGVRDDDAWRPWTLLRDETGKIVTKVKEHRIHGSGDPTKADWIRKAGFRSAPPRQLSWDTDPSRWSMHEHNPSRSGQYEYNIATKPTASNCVQTLFFRWGGFVTIGAFANTLGRVVLRYESGGVCYVVYSALVAAINVPLQMTGRRGTMTSKGSFTPGETALETAFVTLTGMFCEEPRQNLKARVCGRIKWSAKGDGEPERKEKNKGLKRLQAQARKQLKARNKAHRERKAELRRQIAEAREKLQMQQQELASRDEHNMGKRDADQYPIVKET